MDIRTKLALILVFVSLLSMVLLGAFAYQTSSMLLRETSTRHLNALADSKANDLKRVQQGWKDQMNLLLVGDELGVILSGYLASDDQAMPRMTHLVEHVAGAFRNVEQIKVTGLQGKTMVWGKASNYLDVALPKHLGEIEFGGAFLDEDGGLKVVLTALVSFDEYSSLVSAGADKDQSVGIEVVFDARDVANVTTDHNGLGKTGEVMVVALRENESVMLLSPLRHEASSPGRVLPLRQTSEAVQQVLSGKSGVVEGFDDYRGQKTWAAIRFLPELNWGVLVKIDTTEEEEQADTLMGAMFDIGVALSAFAIIGGTLLGFYLARPIHELAVIVGRIRQGESTLRAPVSGDDEIAYLAESLNELLDHMQNVNSSIDPKQDA